MFRDQVDRDCVNSARSAINRDSGGSTGGQTLFDPSRAWKVTQETFSLDWLLFEIAVTFFTARLNGATAGIGRRNRAHVHRRLAITQTDERLRHVDGH
jgi:hypothetical protein